MIMLREDYWNFEKYNLGTLCALICNAAPAIFASQ